MINEVVSRNGRIVPGFEIGLGAAVIDDAAIPAAVAGSSPLTLAVAGGAATAATGWLLESVWRAVRGRRRGRR